MISLNPYSSSSLEFIFLRFKKTNRKHLKIIGFVTTKEVYIWINIRTITSKCNTDHL